MKAGKPYKIKVSDLKYLNLCHNRTYANKRESYTTTQLGLTLIFSEPLKLDFQGVYVNSYQYNHSELEIK